MYKSRRKYVEKCEDISKRVLELKEQSYLLISKNLLRDNDLESSRLEI